MSKTYKLIKYKKGRPIYSRNLNKDATYKWFRKKGVKTLSIKVYDANKFAHDIYKKWGFKNYHIELRKKIK